MNATVQQIEDCYSAAQQIVKRLALAGCSARIIAATDYSKWNSDWNPALFAVLPEFGCEDLISFGCDAYDLIDVLANEKAWYDWYSDSVIIIGHEDDLTDKVVHGICEDAPCCGCCGPDHIGEPDLDIY